VLGASLYNNALLTVKGLNQHFAPECGISHGDLKGSDQVVTVSSENGIWFDGYLKINVASRSSRKTNFALAREV
jgi:hypothetical protein